jgi:hypothetical protein
VISDIHHYFNWGGCIDGDKQNVGCVCGCGLPGQRNDDGDWKGYDSEQLFEKVGRLQVQ